MKKIIPIALLIALLPLAHLACDSVDCSSDIDCIGVSECDPPELPVCTSQTESDVKVGSCVCK